MVWILSLLVGMGLAGTARLLRISGGGPRPLSCSGLFHLSRGHLRVSWAFASIFAVRSQQASSRQLDKWQTHSV